MVTNMVMKFHNFDIFYKMCYIFDLSSALACPRLPRVKHLSSRRIDRTDKKPYIILIDGCMGSYLEKYIYYMILAVCWWDRNGNIPGAFRVIVHIIIWPQASLNSYYIMFI